MGKDSMKGYKVNWKFWRLWKIKKSTEHKFSLIKISINKLQKFSEQFISVRGQNGLNFVFYKKKKNNWPYVGSEIKIETHELKKYVENSFMNGF